RIPKFPLTASASGAIISASLACSFDCDQKYRTPSWFASPLEPRLLSPPGCDATRLALNSAFFQAEHYGRKLDHAYESAYLHRKPHDVLTDGTVLVQQVGSANWFKLSPDQFGSYVNGTWTQLANGPNGPTYYASAVLKDGRIFMAGGEDNFGNNGVDINACEIYDPATPRRHCALPHAVSAIQELTVECTSSGTRFSVAR